MLAMEACPTEGEKNCVLDPISMSACTDAIKGLFNPQARISEFNEKGMVAKEFAGLDWWEDQNILSFTTGAQTGTSSGQFTLYTAAGATALSDHWLGAAGTSWAFRASRHPLLR